MGLRHPRAGPGRPSVAGRSQRRPRCPWPPPRPGLGFRQPSHCLLSTGRWAPLHEGGEGNCTGNSGCKLTTAGTHHSSYHTTIVPLDKNNPQGLQPCGAGAGACCLEGWNVTRIQPGSCSLALCYTFISWLLIRGQFASWRSFGLVPGMGPLDPRVSAPLHSYTRWYKNHSCWGLEISMPHLSQGDFHLTRGPQPRRAYLKFVSRRRWGWGRRPSLQLSLGYRQGLTL